MSSSLSLVYPVFHLLHFLPSVSPLLLHLPPTVLWFLPLLRPPRPFPYLLLTTTAFSSPLYSASVFFPLTSSPLRSLLFIFSIFLLFMPPHPDYPVSFLLPLAFLFHLHLSPPLLHPLLLLLSRSSSLSLLLFPLLNHLLYPCLSSSSFLTFSCPFLLLFLSFFFSPSSLSIFFSSHSLFSFSLSVLPFPISLSLLSSSVLFISTASTFFSCIHPPLPFSLSSLSSVLPPSSLPFAFLLLHVLPYTSHSSTQSSSSCLLLSLSTLRLFSLALHISPLLRLSTPSFPSSSYSSHSSHFPTTFSSSLPFLPL
ncbi:uncharacterized protein LOC118647025 [Monomorium pharaonis]|uniref:uncharacterized protein LOC118647025 n=1 Tax=Monomorium pharaonis TaxID=307658 RepID=UPI001745C472|nr:uncharacterized protein LOC118647025 [Monomorium pharaonis]